ncbi:RNA polymerase sigma factor SigY [Shouchella clausii]|uniref:RNA polymerase sigma factor SigY n=1 Tax=Shouchella clausii TaxID=79880 RepID=A0A268P678_SHOCL|nr:RNA polymerase sigma factor SigY [Shouchella clausii]PAD18252.1 RNA polymerase sigma factor SigY [Shouchella clausii]PAE90770.1 RNA polymerase sigma factor SigY [Shouchella clausii]
MDETALIRKAQKGDQVALATLLHENYLFLRRYALKITLKPSLADDLTQETMTKAIEKIHLYKGRSKFSTWLISIASNLYIDMCRKQSKEELMADTETLLHQLKWEFAHRQLEWMDVVDELGKLSEGYRLPLILKHYYSYRYEEIGKMLGIPEGTVKSRVHHALSLLRKELNVNDEG